MSEGHRERNSADGDATAAEPEASPPPAVEAIPPRRASRATAAWLTALLVLILVGIALSPIWAPEIAPLLPWGARPAVSPDEYAALGARVASVEKAAARPPLDEDAIKQQLATLAGRADRLESAVNTRLAEIENRPASPDLDIAAINSTKDALARRIDALEAARQTDAQEGAGVAATQTALQELERRVDGIQSQLSARADGQAAELQKTNQEISRLGAAVSGISRRVPALERQVQSQAGTERKAATQALLLLQMREAVEQARPFPAEYTAFKALAEDPQIAAVAEPLAGAARNGVASRTVLNKRLNELAGQIATAAEPAAESDWAAQALARIRGLVTIRRIDGASQTGPEAAVGAAQAALARGDLAGAVTALEGLTGASANAARPWLEMARERLSVERALDQLQQHLIARLGGDGAAPTPAAQPPS
jgi:hypothetical protein